MTGPEQTPLRRALAVLKGHWQTAMLIGFAASMVQLLPQVVEARSGVSLLAALLQTLSDESASLSAALSAWRAQGGAWLLALRAASFLLSPVLLAGLNLHLLKLWRGEPAGARDALGRFRHGHRFIGLFLLKLLMVLIPVLPLFALMAGSLYLLSSGSRSLILYSLVNWVSVAVLVVEIRLIYRYALAECLLADRPERKLRSCLRESAALMRGFRMQLFVRELPGLALNLLGILLTSAGSVAGITTGLLAQLAALVLQTALRVGFCLERTAQASLPAETA